MNTLTVGNAAQGENFFNRPDIIDEIWKAIKSNSHILIAAPRRVGKTSIMLNMRDNPRDGYGVIYIITEAAESEAEFWQKLFKELRDDKNLNRIKRYAQSTFSALFNTIKNIKKVTTSGVEFGDGITLNHEEAFEKLVRGLNIDKKLVIMIDEFPQTIENIRDYEDDKSARSFLKTNRSLRQNPDITDKILFIYTGSIGLESVANQLNGSKFINDLNRVKVHPLSDNEARQFIEELLSIEKLEMNQEVQEYLLNQIEWFIPFYFQLIIKEVSSLCTKEEIDSITVDTIDRAIDGVLDYRNQFDHWHSRLKLSFDKPSYKYAKEILNYISEEKTIETNTIKKIAEAYTLDDEKEIIHSLVYDGYINNNDDSKIYRFNSPILRMWWNKNVAN